MKMGSNSGYDGGKKGNHKDRHPMYPELPPNPYASPTPTTPDQDTWFGRFGQKKKKRKNANRF